MNNMILVKELSKEGHNSTSLFKIIEEGVTRYYVINFEGFKVSNQMEVCENTFTKLKG